MIPHYVSQDMLAMLSAGPGEIASGTVLYSDRGLNRYGEWVFSPNKKAVLWMQSDGQLVIYGVTDPSQTIIEGEGLVAPDKRYAIWNYATATKDTQFTHAPGTQGPVTFLQVNQDGLTLKNFDGKQVNFVPAPSGPGVVALQLMDDGNLVLTKGGTPIWSLFTAKQPPPAAGSGFDIKSLLLPAAAGIGLLLFLKKK
jgi:hypothetical protein